MGFSGITEIFSSGVKVAKKYLIQAGALAVALSLLPKPAEAGWMKGNGLDTMDVYGFAIHGTTVFASTKDGVYKSTDNGLNWAAARTGLPASKVQAFAVGDSVVLAGTLGNGIYRSKDLGSTWVQSDSGLTDTYINAFAVMGTRIVAGTGRAGIFVSENDGETWTQRNSGLTNMLVFSFLIHGRELFALSNTGDVHVSSDTGMHWSSISANLPPSDFPGQAELGADLFLGTDGEILKSADDGAKWSSAYGNLPPNQEVSALRVVEGNLLVALDAGGIFLTGNLGASWTAINQGLTNLQVEALSIGTGYLFLGTLGAGAWRIPISEISNIAAGALGPETLPFKIQSTAHAFKFTLPREMEVSIGIYDLRGNPKIRKNLGWLAGGAHAIPMSDLGLCPGFYTFAIQLGRNQISKSMLITH